MVRSAKRLSANPAEGGPWSEKILAETIDMAVLHNVLSISLFRPEENATFRFRGPCPTRVAVGHEGPLMQSGPRDVPPSARSSNGAESIDVGLDRRKRLLLPVLPKDFPLQESLPKLSFR